MCYSFWSEHEENTLEAFHAMSADIVLDVVTPLRQGRMPQLHSLDLGLRRLPISTARTSMQLPPSWCEKIQQCHPGRAQVLSVSQLLHSGSRDDQSDWATVDSEPCP